MSSSTLSLFLDSLVTEGRVRVSRPQEIPRQRFEELDERLVGLERQWALDLPGRPPPLEIRAASWAAVQFYRACQFVVYRDIDARAIAETLASQCPAGGDAATHYSVDLTFRYLPDLLKLARGASEGDPLVQHLRQWAGHWPLSSVGIAGVQPSGVAILTADPCLLKMYVDRIIARRDISRLDHSGVREAVAAALAFYPELAPEVAGALRIGAGDGNQQLQGKTP